ncbi:hypothetical protein FGO68_gene12592 [Halteria grandinella]|uniref:FAD-binding domain-containing protein n=1 Tax=Halteria grandinella TaxID=5974 RepID=A0A8J8NR86_HALGN|nr:hypothetical protein FGO68_gene12592 [Halteria grandinella]
MDLQESIDRIAIVGAGPVGLTLAIALAERGFGIDIYEPRYTDSEGAQLSNGRSINFTIMERGLKAFDIIGMRDQIIEIGVVLKQRTVHFPDDIMINPFGGNITSTVRREDLQRVLYKKAAEFSQIKLINARVTSVDIKKGEVAWSGQQETGVQAYLQVFGADGAHSTVRQSFQKYHWFELQQETLNLGYIEFLFPPELAKGNFEADTLHLWPRPNCYLFGLPNNDGSITINFFYPLTGPNSFEQIKSNEDFKNVFTQLFPNTLKCIPDLDSLWSGLKVSYLQDFQCFPFSHGRASLIGDAGHTIQPYQGQGVNLGLEDVSAIVELFDQHKDDWEKINQEYSLSRKQSARSAKLLTDLTLVEYTKELPDPSFKQVCRIIGYLLKNYSPVFCTHFQLIAFTHADYCEAEIRQNVERKIIQELVQRSDLNMILQKDVKNQEILKLLARYGLREEKK